VKRISVDVEDELHQRLRVLTARHDVSIRFVVTALVHSWVTKKEGEDERVRPAGSDER
jgi:plasmid stability protein